MCWIVGSLFYYILGMWRVGSFLLNVILERKLYPWCYTYLLQPSEEIHDFWHDLWKILNFFCTIVLQNSLFIFRDCLAKFMIFFHNHLMQSTIFILQHLTIAVFSRLRLGIYIFFCRLGLVPSLFFFLYSLGLVLEHNLFRLCQAIKFFHEQNSDSWQCTFF